MNFESKLISCLPEINSMCMDSQCTLLCELSCLLKSLLLTR